MAGQGPARAAAAAAMRDGDWEPPGLTDDELRALREEFFRVSTKVRDRGGTGGIDAKLFVRGLFGSSADRAGHDGTENRYLSLEDFRRYVAKVSDFEDLGELPPERNDTAKAKATVAKDSSAEVARRRTRGLREVLPASYTAYSQGFFVDHLFLAFCDDQQRLRFADFTRLYAFWQNGSPARKLVWLYSVATNDFALMQRRDDVVKHLRACRRLMKEIAAASERESDAHESSNPKLRQQFAVLASLVRWMSSEKLAPASHFWIATGDPTLEEFVRAYMTARNVWAEQGESLLRFFHIFGDLRGGSTDSGHGARKPQEGTESSSASRSTSKHSTPPSMHEAGAAQSSSTSLPVSLERIGHALGAMAKRTRHKMRAHVDERSLFQLMSEMGYPSRSLCRRVIAAYTSQMRPDTITMQDMLEIGQLLSSGSPVDKLLWLFRLVDTDRDGLVSRREVHELAADLLDAYRAEQSMASNTVMPGRPSTSYVETTSQESWEFYEDVINLLLDEAARLRRCWRSRQTSKADAAHGESPARDAAAMEMEEVAPSDSADAELFGFDELISALRSFKFRVRFLDILLSLVEPPGASAQAQQDQERQDQSESGVVKEQKEVPESTASAASVGASGSPQAAAAPQARVRHFHLSLNPLSGASQGPQDAVPQPALSVEPAQQLVLPVESAELAEPVHEQPATSELAQMIPAATPGMEIVKMSVTKDNGSVVVVKEKNDLNQILTLYTLSYQQDAHPDGLERMEEGTMGAAPRTSSMTQDSATPTPPAIDAVQPHSAAFVAVPTGGVRESPLLSDRERKRRKHRAAGSGPGRYRPKDEGTAQPAPPRSSVMMAVMIFLVLVSLESGVFYSQVVTGALYTTIQDEFGVDDSAMGLLGSMLVTGWLFSLFENGFVLGRFGVVAVLTLNVAFQMIGGLCFLLAVPAESFALLCVGCLMLGLGDNYYAISVVAARYYTHSLGLVFGMINSYFMLFSGLGGVMHPLLADVGGLQLALIVIAATPLMSLVALGFFILLRSRFQSPSDDADANIDEAGKRRRRRKGPGPERLQRLVVGVRTIIPPIRPDQTPLEVLRDAFSIIYLLPISFWFLCLFSFLVLGTTNSALVYVPPLLQQNFDLSEGLAALLVPSVVNWCSILFNPLTGLIFDTRGMRLLVTLGALSLTIVTTILLFFQFAGDSIAVPAIYALTLGFLQSAARGIGVPVLSLILPAHLLAAATTLYFIVFATAVISYMYMGGGLVQALGYRTLGAVYVVSCLLAALALVILRRVTRQEIDAPPWRPRIVLRDFRPSSR